MKTIGTILAIILLIAAGYFIFRGDRGDVANVNTGADNLDGTGGADEGFDPLQNYNLNGVEGGEDKG